MIIVFSLQSLDDLEGDDNSADENDTDRVVTKSIVSTIKKPNENKLIEEKRQDQDMGRTRLQIPQRISSL